MNEKLFVGEWEATRRRSVQALPVAVVLFVALSAVVVVENLHQSEFGFLAGILVGIHASWAVLEVVTILKVSRLLRRAAATGGEAPQAS